MEVLKIPNVNFCPPHINAHTCTHTHTDVFTYTLSNKHTYHTHIHTEKREAFDFFPYL